MSALKERSPDEGIVILIRSLQLSGVIADLQQELIFL